MSRKTKTVTAPVTPKELTLQQKLKLIEPVQPEIDHAMKLSHHSGKMLGHVEGHAEGLQEGLIIPRTRGERIAQENLPAIDVVLAEVRRELVKAYTKFPQRQSSPHESYAVLLEETNELWDEIKADRGRMASGRQEGVQAAAMAVRYLVDINPR